MPGVMQSDPPEARRTRQLRELTTQRLRTVRVPDPVDEEIARFLPCLTRCQTLAGLAGSVRLQFRDELCTGPEIWPATEAIRGPQRLAPNGISSVTIFFNVVHEPAKSMSGLMIGRTRSFMIGGVTLFEWHRN